MTSCTLADNHLTNNLIAGESTNDNDLTWTHSQLELDWYDNNYVFVCEHTLKLGYYGIYHHAEV